MRQGDVVELELVPGKHVIDLQFAKSSKTVNLEGGRLYVLIVGVNGSSFSVTESPAALREVLSDEMMQITHFDPKKRPGGWSEIMAQQCLERSGTTLDNQ
jgi:hypothetical protein